MQLNRTLLNLKVVGMVRQHERLSTRGSKVFVDRPSTWQGVRRWIRGDHRSLNMDVLDQVFEGAFLYLQQNSGSESLRVVRELIRACQGITNLQTTYEGDTETVARLQLIVDAVRERLSEYLKGNEIVSLISDQPLRHQPLRHQCHQSSFSSSPSFTSSPSFSSSPAFTSLPPPSSSLPSPSSSLPPPSSSTPSV